MSSGLSVTLEKSDNPRVEYTIKKGKEENLVIKVKNGVLYVKTKSNFGGWGNSIEANVTIYYEALDQVSVAAGTTLRSDDVITASDMDVEVSSGSTAKLVVEAKTIDVEVSSGATLRIKGEAERGKFEASSGSTLNGSGFEVDHAQAEASSGATLMIHVNDSLDAEANSGASIRYSGSVSNVKSDDGWSGSIKRAKG